MDEDVKHFMVQEETCIKDAMRVIDHGGVGMVFILDNKNRFIGLVTDGDIRRAVINGVNLNKPVIAIANTNPIVAHSSWSEERLDAFLKSMQAKIPPYGSLKIPLLDDDGHVADIIFVSSERCWTGFHKGCEAKKERMVKNVLVIGGAGYLGSVLSRRLLEKGYKVRALDNLTYGDEGIKGLYDNPGFTFIEGDMRDINTVVNAIKGMDAVVHLAAIVGDPASSLSPQKTIEINYLATKLVAEVCKYHQLNRFIFASTCSVYGANPNPDVRLDENSQLNPVSLYAEMKLKSEEGLLEMIDTNFSPTILRMATLYGLSPRMRFDLVVNLLTAKAVFDHEITIFGGSQWRPNLHVMDAAEAFIKCLEAPIEKIRGGIFNVGTNNQNHQILEIGNIIHEVIPNAGIETAEDNVDERDYNISFDKIAEVLEYGAKKSIKDGVAEIKKAIEEGKVKDYKDRRYSNYKSLS